MNRLLPFLLVLAVLSAPPLRAQQDKRAQTGMKFLSTSVDARASALGNGVTALTGMPTALFYNPAGLATQQNLVSAAASQVQFIADIDYNTAAVSFAPMGGRLGVVGVSLLFVDYGTFQETIRANNDDGFVDLGTFSPSAYSVGLGYARALTDRFSIGGQVKYVSQDLGNPVDERGADGSLTRAEAREGTLAYDFGMLYRTGFRSLNFAVSARNFSPEIEFVEESFELPLELRIGFAFDLVDLTSLDRDLHSLLFVVDTSKPRDFTEQVNLGAEYGFLNTLFLRAGYVSPTDEQGVSLGVGVQREIRGLGFGADYAYTDFGTFNEFGKVHRLSLRFSL